MCPIKAGEQVTISYLSTDTMCQSAASRSEQLQLWHFKCGCSFCCLPSTEQQQSDKRRAELLDFEVPYEGPLPYNHEAQMHATIKAMVLSTKEALWERQLSMISYLAFRCLA